MRADTVIKFLPVYDNLVRALEQPTADEAYRKGVEMTMAQFRDILGRLGVTEIEAVGRTFDPAVHNAVMHDTDETKGEGEIVQGAAEGLQAGRQGDTLLDGQSGQLTGLLPIHIN